jgi:trehalose 6-phosphate synthase
VIVLANRAPFRHERGRDGGVVLERSASGVVTALEPLVSACSGVWVAHGAGSADRDRVDRRDGLNVPPANPRYRLRYVWLQEEEHRGYYYGFANEGLWPLCHRVPVQPVFRPEDYRQYWKANTRFAAAVADEAAGQLPLVLVQDYHFALAPRMLRRAGQVGPIVTFWHIPWPDPRAFRTCPWHRELVDGLLGSDIVGFQTAEDCQRFLQTAASVVDADVDEDDQSVTHRGVRTLVRAYPVGIDRSNRFLREAPGVRACREQVWRDLGLPADVRLGVGVDRLDYTKGIAEKFLAIERLLDVRREVRGRFVFVQVAEPSRDRLPAYRAARAEIVATCARVNGRFGTTEWCPIVLLEAHHEPSEIYRFYRAADLCYVNSLHDGMNLVAKEFVSARDDNRGVLVLSRFAGSAQQLTAALLVDPREPHASADVLARALSMPDAEQAIRMRMMRDVVTEFDAYWWANQLLDVALQASSLRHAVAPDGAMQAVLGG